MDAGAAIAAVRNYIQEAHLDYPTEGLAAERFEVGWSVYAPVAVDTGDPLAFLDVPVGRAVFLIADSGRIEQSSSSVPPATAQSRFAEQEYALSRRAATADPTQFITEFAQAFEQAGGSQVASGFTIADAPDPAVAARDEQVRAATSKLLEPIAQQLAQLGPPGWQDLLAVFSLTVAGEIALLSFTTADGQLPVEVPQTVLELVRQHRQTAAAMSAGPWWRLMLAATSQGRMQVGYDYGDDPPPEGQLQPAQNYRDDLATYPRRQLPVWLAGYLAGPSAQGRSPEQAATAAAADRTAGRYATDVDDLDSLADMWAGWAVLAAVSVGAHSQWGPRIAAGLAWFESPARSGATLYLLPGDRAVLSGGRWNSPLLVAAYQHHQPLPELYTGAPGWVNDTVLNTRNRNGLLSFCYWCEQGRWWRGDTDTFDDLEEALPVIWTPDDTVAAMTAVVGPASASACHTLLAAATDRAADADLVAAVFAGFTDPDVDAALAQLATAGLTR